MRFQHPARPPGFVRPRAIQLAVLAAALGFLPGCWTITRPPAPSGDCWSEPEQSTERSRSLQGVSAQQALDAAERILQFAWGENASIRRLPLGISAEVHRERTYYLFLVAHRAVTREAWIIDARQERGGVGVCIQLRGQSVTDTFVLGAEPVTNVVYPASSADRSPSRVLPRAQALAIDFETFWARLEYLIGKRQVWPGCSASGPHRNEARDRMEFDPLCQAAARDRLPATPPTGTP